jgi:peptidoglycan/LPS O-acetylase OafA/YrhL
MGLLRFLLAISVVINHTGPFMNLNFVGGRLAVQAFYIISGFYMTMVLNEKYIGQNKSYKLFISNRLLRLYPIFWTVMISTVLFSFLYTTFTGTGDFLRLSTFKEFSNQSYALILSIVANVALIGQDIMMFLGLDSISGKLFFTSNFANIKTPMHIFLMVPQAWTLSIEIMFYLIAPFILRKNWKFIMVLMLVSLLTRIYTYYGLNLTNDPWTYRFFPSELFFFLLGYFSYKMFLKLKDLEILHRYKYVLISFLSVYIITYFSLPKFGMNQFFMDMVFFCIVFFSIPVVFIQFKKNKWDNWIGELSYPIYISHIFILIIYSTTKFSYNKSVYFVVLMSVVFSILLNKFIADPIEKLRQSRIKK